MIAAFFSRYRLALPKWALHRHLRYVFLCLIVGLQACSTQQTHQPGFNGARPLSILVLPPINDSMEVNASYTFLSTITRPLAEKGYYVFPVALIDQLLKENGLPTPHEMHSAPLDKLTHYIGADAVLYVHIDDWGQKYQVISSSTVIRAKLHLVDARTGATLWEHSMYEAQSNNHSSNGLAGLLIGAVVDQIAGSLSDSSHDLSRVANNKAFLYNNSRWPDGPYREVLKMGNNP